MAAMLRSCTYVAFACAAARASSEAVAPVSMRARAGCVRHIAKIGRVPKGTETNFAQVGSAATRQAPLPHDWWKSKRAPKAVSPFRLRARPDFSEVAPYVADIKIDYDPFLPGTTGCQQLWFVAGAKPIRAQYPKYTITRNENEDEKPATIAVKFSNGKSILINAQGMNLYDVLDAMKQHTAGLEAADEMAEMDKN